VLEAWVKEPGGVSGSCEALLSGDHSRAAAIADDGNLAAAGSAAITVCAPSFGAHAAPRTVDGRSGRAWVGGAPAV